MSPRVHSTSAPAAWLVDNIDAFPADRLSGPARALDIACGDGRGALWLATFGYTVDAVDRDESALAAIDAQAARHGLSVRTMLTDLEQPALTLGAALYDVIVVFRYLHRPLFPALRRALRPGGVLVYETFTSAQAARGRPTNPAFLLEPGELTRLVAPLTVVREREGDFDGAFVASVVAVSTDF